MTTTSKESDLKVEPFAAPIEQPHSPIPPAPTENTQATPLSSTAPIQSEGVLHGAEEKLEDLMRKIAQKAGEEFEEAKLKLEQRGFRLKKVGEETLVYEIRNGQAVLIDSNPILQQDSQAETLAISTDTASNEQKPQ